MRSGNGTLDAMERLYDITVGRAKRKKRIQRGYRAFNIGLSLPRHRAVLDTVGLDHATTLAPEQNGSRKTSMFACKPTSGVFVQTARAPDPHMSGRPVPVTARPTPSYPTHRTMTHSLTTSDSNIYSSGVSCTCDSETHTIVSNSSHNDPLPGTGRPRLMRRSVF